MKKHSSSSAFSGNKPQAVTGESNQVFSSPLLPKLIYVMRINDAKHKNCLKIGDTTADCKESISNLPPNCAILNEAAHKRIKSYTQTAAITYELLYTECTIYFTGKKIKSFRDYDVHEVLKRSGIKKKQFDKKNKADEWFVTDLETAKKAIQAVKKGKTSLNASEISNNQSPVVFRPEQREAIDKTLKQFKKSNQMLWNAKMRFGKTLSALQVVKEMDFSRTLILTHRPVVNQGWFEDFKKIFYNRADFSYSSKDKGSKISSLLKKSMRFVYFASMQDLRGSEIAGGKFNKNNEIFAIPWDFMIVDEAHEGTQTQLGQNVLNELIKKDTKVLHLSGTPFNLLDNYEDDEVFTWDYIMEQKAKLQWDLVHKGDCNPYSELPRLNIFTFDLGKMLNLFQDENLAFNFREFFRVDECGDFIHKKDVCFFLDLICKTDNSSHYPYSTEEYRNHFRHSLWMIPGVKEAKALSAMLKKHKVFSQFQIINVAGDGDEEEENNEALSKVLSAIGNDPDQTYTITLSCGRLTTGVSVPAWTAVFMLSGTYNTSATSYMQTIFRVQTPATINGRIKTECFVFDFAPDRTLKIIAETAEISQKRSSDSDKHKVMGEFLNFCPVISIDGTQMTEYNVGNMLEQLKKVYIDRVVNRGFEDNHLYNDKMLMKLTGQDLSDFDNLQKIIGKTKAMSPTNEIDINRQGFSEEEHAKADQAEKKQKEGKKLSKAEKELLERKKALKKQRDTAISILRGISIRMPLMIYGAELKNESDEITIDNFCELIDQSSWEEFMPRGVSKELFQSFKKYYDPDVFCSAGKRIRSMTKSSDSEPIVERIKLIAELFSKFRNPDKETVLTPWRVVNMHMSDCLGGYCFFDDSFESKLNEPKFIERTPAAQEVFSSDSHILEINSKTGLYPLYVAYCVFQSRRQTIMKIGVSTDLSIKQQYELWDSVLKENIFVICKTPMAKSITKRTLMGFRSGCNNIKYYNDLVATLKKSPDKFTQDILSKSFWDLKGNDKMKFNAIVGNPPYQVMDGGTQSSASPVYNLFVQAAKNMDANYISLIMPSRWFAGGKGLDKFREEMLEDKSIRVIHDFLDAVDCFGNGVEIKGGICYFLREKNYQGSCTVFTHDNNGKIAKSERYLKAENSDVFIRYKEGVSIYDKVRNKKEKTLENFVSTQKPFGLRTFVHGQKKPFADSIKLYENGGIGFIERDRIKNNIEWIEKHKVYVSRAYNAGDTYPHQIIGKPIYGEPGSCCTETYIVIGPYKDENTAKNVIKYISTKFFRFLVMLKKASQQAAANVYSFVPIQDFSDKSKIDWTKEPDEIDKILFKKYGFNQEEINFINLMIKSM